MSLLPLTASRVAKSVAVSTPLRTGFSIVVMTFGAPWCCVRVRCWVAGCGDRRKGAFPGPSPGRPAAEGDGDDRKDEVAASLGGQVERLWRSRSRISSPSPSLRRPHARPWLHVEPGTEGRRREGRARRIGPTAHRRCTDDQRDDVRGHDSQLDRRSPPARDVRRRPGRVRLRLAGRDGGDTACQGSEGDHRRGHGGGAVRGRSPLHRRAPPRCAGHGAAHRRATPRSPWWWGRPSASHTSRIAGWAGIWVIFGGSAHLATLRALDGGSAVLAVVTGLLVNARLLVYSASLSSSWRDQPRWFRLVGAALVIDPTWMAAERRAGEPGTPEDHRRFFLGAGVTLGAAWGALVTVGMLLGDRASGWFDLQVAVPLCLVALVGPRLARARREAGRRRGRSGGGGDHEPAGRVGLAGGDGRRRRGRPSA